MPFYVPVCGFPHREVYLRIDGPRHQRPQSLYPRFRGAAHGSQPKGQLRTLTAMLVGRMRPTSNLMCLGSVVTIVMAHRAVRSSAEETS
jgi:hypothetical protein